MLRCVISIHLFL